MFDDLLDRLERPEYTGPNRCLPCTIVNLAIAATVGALVARRSRLAGVLVTAASLALVYLRGYLVPGTPTLTKRYLPAAVLEWFGKDPDPALASGFGSVATDPSADEPALERETGSERADSSAVSSVGSSDDENDDTSDTDGVDTPADHTGAPDTVSSGGAVDPADHVDLESYFLTHGVLEPCAEEDDLCLTDEFERAWFAETAAVEEAGLDAAAVVDAFGFDADPTGYELRARGDVRTLASEAGLAGRWPSRAAVLADVAAGRVLGRWVPDWDATDPATRGRICNALRMFLERCPTGGDVTMGEDVVESCCTSHDVIAVTCEETGERLFEQRLDALD